jgi:hypothetical protein
MYTEPPDGRYNLASVSASHTKPSISTQIIQAKHSNIDDILHLRKVAEENLKHLSDSEVANNINQFYLAVIEDTIVGCCRIFETHEIYELGSLVSLKKWVWSALVAHAENFAKEKHKWIMAVTRSKILLRILEKRKWTASNKLSKRLKDSPKWSKLRIHWHS